MESHLFQSLPVGTLFFRDPFNELENPSIKVDATHARKPGGDVSEVNGGVLVFTAFSTFSVIPVELIPQAIEIISRMERQ